MVRTRSGEDRWENYLSLTAGTTNIVARGKKLSETLNKRLKSMLGEDFHFHNTTIDNQVCDYDEHNSLDR
jgi:hypothetical protein